MAADTAIHRTLSATAAATAFPSAASRPVANRRGGLEDPQRLTDGEGRRRRGVGRARRAAHDAEAAPKGPVRRHAADLNHVVVGLASSDEEERVEHGRVAKVEFDPGPYRPGRRWPSSESCRGVGGPVSHLRGHTPRRACEPLALAAWGTPIDKRLSLYCWARCRDAAREPRARLDKTTSASRPLGARAPGWRGPGWPGREAEPIEPAGQRPIAGCRTLARPTGDHSRGCEQPSLAGRPDRAVDPGRARCCHAGSLVRRLLTSGVHEHSLPCGFVRLRPSHLGRAEWPSTTIAAMTAAVSSSGCRWGRPRRRSRARAAVGTPRGSSPCR